MHYLHSRFRCTTQGALAVRLRGPLDLGALAQAVETVRRRHEMLGVVVIEQDGELYFARPDAEGPPPLEVRPRRADGDWRREMQDENHRPLDPSRQLWRLVVLAPEPGGAPVFDLILSMHHAAMDGTASDSFLNEVLALATTGAPPGEAAGAAPLPPAAEACCASTCSWQKFGELQRRVAAETAAAEPPAHLAEAPLSERRTVVAALRLASERYRALARECDGRGVTFNSYVSAALLAALRRHGPRRRFALYTAVSLRRLCPALGEGDMGCYLSVLPTFHELPAAPAELFALADEHQRALPKSFLAYGRPPSDYDAAALREGAERLALARTFVNDVGFTYAEMRLRPAFGALRVEHVYVAANRTAGNVALMLHGLRLGDEVFFTLSHTEPLQDPAWAAAVRNDFAGMLGTVDA